MKQIDQFRIDLSKTDGDRKQQLRAFALLNLGLVQSMASGIISAAEAIRLFYHADNCLYVQKRFRSREANAIMSRGVQLPDLFECLPAEAAFREFFHELEVMRSLCSKLLKTKRAVGNRQRVTV